MARRVIAIPLAVAIVIAVFSVFVLGVDFPLNDIITELNVYSQVYSSNSDGTNSLIGFVSLSDYFNYYTGTPYLFGTSILSSGSPYFGNHTFSSQLSFSLSRSYDFYILVRDRVLSNGLYSFLMYVGDTPYDLLNYHNPNRDIKYTFENPSLDLIQWDLSNNIPSKVDTGTRPSISCTFMCFENVPLNAALYITDNSFKSSATDDVYGNVYNGIYYTFRVMGVYVSPQSLTSEEVVDRYIDGDSSFSDSLTALNTAINDAINSTDDMSQKQFELLKGQYELERLVVVSNDKSINDIKNNVTPAFDNQINDYVYGSASLDDTIASMSSTYTEALSSAETPEQGILVNTTYEIKMQQLEFEARQKAAEKMDSAITDEDQQEAKDYYDLESNILSLFDLQEFKDQLVFDEWYQSMSLTEAVSYKSIYEWFLNDSELRYWLIVPISYIIITLLLGTAYRMAGKSK